ncbi:kinase-like domain-containing protein [Boeremia exigua]|uniref:kinase-like domain-containing protein n=1 Tax=Boeremia exigua TaxID=749465 RepID=UPI001E8D23EA|nr:kinase-like domain-containing protein [Boeremia exigua]KAH6625483.1 kinase-like domain-containing protein [Boeremia exigua]
MIPGCRLPTVQIDSDTMASQLPKLNIEDEPYEDEHASENNNTTVLSVNNMDLSDDTPLAELRILLLSEAIDHADSQVGSFWSTQRLQYIMTVERITAHLNKRRIDDAQSIAATIRANLMRVFAALTFGQMDFYITSFIEEGLTDEDLPLIKADFGKGPNGKVKNVNSEIARKKTPHLPLECFENWKPVERDHFLVYQYRFLPAILEFKPGEQLGSRVIQHMEIEDAVILPFTSCESIRDGGYGSVTEVGIHPDCHRFQDILRSIVINDKFADKQLLYTDNHQEFQKEIEALKRFNGFAHPHLVTLLTTWTRRKQHHFLFPLAGCNLEDYWDKNKSGAIRTSQDLDIPTVQWISKQICGMVQALHTVHEPSKYLEQDRKYGRHGDLKPENVLWYRSPEDPRGILVIADLGLSSVNTEKSRSNIPNKGIPHTPGYRPPECDLEGGTISRAYDIWTLGCLLLELVTWALGGESSRTEFEDKRMTPYVTGVESNIFFDVKIRRGGFDHVMVVKDSVSEWIAQLHGRSTCTAYFSDVLELIQKGMLVMLSEEHTRYSSMRILRRIEDMHKRVMDPLDGYCRIPSPQQRKPEYCVPVEANLNFMAKREIRRTNPRLNVYGGIETKKSKTMEQLSRME